MSFKLYRIIRTIDGKALVYGSDCPHGHRGDWYDRGHWSDTTGTFWKTEGTVKKHLQNLCHDWGNFSKPVPWRERWPGEEMHWRAVLPGTVVQWVRLNFLSVERILVTKYTTASFAASDFMGIPNISVEGQRPAEAPL